MKALSIKNLSKTYRGGFKALDNVNLEIEQGDFFALLGPNGAGKSTTIGILTSLITKTSGSVKIFGTDIDKDFAKAKTYIGVVPQEFNFGFFETVEQIILNQAGYYGIELDVAKERLEFYLDKLGLKDKRHTTGGKLSGGMKRRLMIARALIHEPQLLVLDEPTAGVDIELRRSMWEFIVGLNKKGTTIILTTHYLEEAEQLAKHLAIIHKGKVIEQGPKRSLLRKLQKESLIIDTKENLPKNLEIKDIIIKPIDCNTLEVDFSSKKTSITQIILELRKKGIEVISVRNKSNRLEELFLELTGGKNNT